MMIGGFILTSFSIGLENGVYNHIIREFTNHKTGQIQIHKGDYTKEPTIYKIIYNYEDYGEKVEKLKDVKGVSYRLYGFSIVSSSVTTAAQIVGIDIEREEKFADFSKKIKEGQNISIHNGCLIGIKLARVLKCNIGDTLVFLSQGVDGSIANDFFIVQGFVETGDEMSDRRIIYVSLNDFQEFFSIYGGVHEIAVFTYDINHLDKIKNEIENAINDSTLTVETWKEFMSSFYKAMKADKQGGYISVFIVMLMFAIGIFNTVLMAVLERMKEYGLMKALGTTPSMIFVIVVSEMMIIAFISCIIGIVGGFLVNWFFIIHPITLSQSIQYGGINFSTMSTEIMPEIFWIPVLIVLLTTFLVTLIPAIKAAKSTPMEIMRFK